MDAEIFKRLFTHEDQFGDAYAEPATVDELARVIVEACSEVPGDNVSLCFGEARITETPLGGKIADYEFTVSVWRHEDGFGFFDEEGDADIPTPFPTAKDGLEAFKVGGRPLASYVPGIRVYPPMDDL